LDDYVFSDWFHIVYFKMLLIQKELTERKVLGNLVFLLKSFSFTGFIIYHKSNGYQNIHAD